MFKDYTLQTTWGRALIALVGGVAIGAVFVAGYLTLDKFSLFGANPPLSRVVLGFIVSLLIGVWTWGLGILFVGLPIWFALHKAGFRTVLSALSVGFILPFVAGLLFFAIQFYSDYKIQARYRESGFSGGNFTSLDWEIIATASSVLGFVGVLVALTIWRIAYHRPPPC